MADKNTIFLKIVKLTPEELKIILQVAVNLLYADGMADIEEWNILTLIPALLDVIKEDTPEELKEKWGEKLEIASKALEQEGEKPLDAINIKKKIKQPEARKSCILLLFMIACSDRKVHKRELEYIMEEIVGPWKISKEELVMLIKCAENEIRDAGDLIRMIEGY